jgi:hypothetical protein
MALLKVTFAVVPFGIVFADFIKKDWPAEYIPSALESWLMLHLL